MDLHWSTLPGPDGGDGVFRRARPATLLGMPTLVPAPTDLLLSVITHGTNWYPEPVRWALDASYLLSSVPEEIDWDLLVAQARLHRYAWPVGLALDALQRDYGGAVSPGVPQSLLAAPGSVVEGALWRLQRDLPQRGVRYPFLFNEWLRARRQPYPGGPRRWLAVVHAKPPGGDEPGRPGPKAVAHGPPVTLWPTGRP